MAAGTGLFVSFEFTLIGLGRSTVDSDYPHSAGAAAESVHEAHNRLSFRPSGAQPGATLTALTVGSLAEPILAQYFMSMLEWTGLGESAAGPATLILALIVIMVLSTVYGELVSKDITITQPLAVTCVTAYPVMALN